MAILDDIDGVPAVTGSETMDSTESGNKATVAALYKALMEKGRREDDDQETTAARLSKLLASDLEWWFHGPPGCQHMMRVLTGDRSSSGQGEFVFEPRSIEVVGSGRVIVEGWEGAKAYWVHVWTVKDGLITQFREYFNTWLTVKGVIKGEQRRSRTTTLWRSQPRDLYSRSLPTVLLAI